MGALPIILSLSLGLGAIEAPGLVPLVGPSGADKSAEGPSPEAVEAFFRGRDLYAQAKYDEALEAFLEADRLHPAPDLQYNIGLCHTRLANWEEAISSFEIYLRTKEDAPDRADVEARIAEARQNIEARRPDPGVGPMGPDGSSTGDSSGELGGPPVDQGPAEAGNSHRALIISGGVLLGLGVVGAVAAATGIGVVIDDKNEQLDTIQNEGNPRDVSYAEALELEDEAKRLVTYQWVSIGVGAAVAVAGATLLGIGLKRRKSARSTATALSPWWSPRGGGGLAVQGRF
jgi:tetratricopeptide (TPR) repeat protein